MSGREWAGLDLHTSEGETYTLEASLSFCDVDHGTTSQPDVVIEEGVAHVLHHDGDTPSQWGYATLTVDVDYLAGAVLLTLAAGADVDALTQSIANRTGAAEVAYESVDPDTWRVTWTSSTPFAAVLGVASGNAEYVAGEPEWIEVPDWW